MDNKALFEKLSKNRRHLANQLLSPAVAGFWQMVIDKYSEKAHFLYELLQNADDAKAISVRIILEPNGIYFIHNGNVPFSITDPDLEGTGTTIGHINSLTSVGCSTKLNSESVIGKFGIGFKSVFQYTDHPHIEDDNFSFCLTDYIVPVLESRLGKYRQKGDSLFYLPFSNPEQAYDEVLSSLRQIQNPLFFLNHLESFSWQLSVNEEGVTFTKQILKSDCFSGLNGIDVRHSVVRLNSSPYHYLTTTVEHNNQSFDCSIVYGFGTNGVFESIYSESNVFCFFPTEESMSGLPFLLHAPFLLTENRERIKRNDDWNQHLLEVLAQLATSILLYEPFLQSPSYSRLTDFFPLENVPHNGFISSPFIDSFQSTLYTVPVVKTDDGGYTTCDKVLFCNNSEFTHLFSSLNSDLFGLPNLCWGYTFLYELSASDRTRSLEVLNKLGLIPKFQTIESLLENLDTTFLENQSQEWWLSFYRFLLKHKSLCASNVLRQKNLILCDDGVFRSVYSKSQTPQIFLKSNVTDCSADGLYYVDDILNTKDMSLFCSAMGINKPSEATYIEKTLLQKYIKRVALLDDLLSISVDIVRLANYFASIVYNNELKSRFLSLVGDIPFIPTIINGNKSFSVARTAYFYSDDLHTYFGDSNGYAYLNQQLILAIDASQRERVYFFLHSLGVSFYPRIKSVLRSPSLAVLNELDLHPLSLRSKDNGGQVIEDKELDGFSNLLEHWTKESALALFHLLGKMVGECGAYSFKKMLQGLYTYYEKGKKTETTTSIIKTTAYSHMFESSWLPSFSYNKIKLSEVFSCDDLCTQCLCTDIDFQTLQFLGIRYDSALSNLTESQRHDINLIDRLKKQGYSESDLMALINGTASIIYHKN